MNKTEVRYFEIHHYLVALLLIVFGAAIYMAQESHSLLEGVVMESGTDLPLGAVQVSASTEEVSVSGVTDSSGRFKIEVPRPGRYRVVPSLKGFVYAHPERIKTGRPAGVWVQIAQGRTLPRVELRMAKPGTITGRVVAPTGDTLPGNVASVTLLQHIYDASGRRTLENVPGLHFGFDGSFVRMDDRGEYRFYDVPPGDYYVGIFDGRVVGAASTFYPGTSDEARALPVHVKPGEEVRLSTVILPPKRATDVRLRFPNAAGADIGQTIMLHSSRVSVMGRRRSVDGEDEITLPFAPGHYELFVGAGPLASSLTRTSSDALFGVISLDVEETLLDRQVVMSRGLKVTGSATLVNEAGVRSAVKLYPPRGGLECRLKLDSDPSLVLGGGSVCFGAQFPAGTYHLELGQIPSDQYIQSVSIGSRDVLADGIQLNSDIDLQIVLATPGAIIEGVAKDALGEKMPDAVVVLVPDQPYRSYGGPLYRSTISDVSGNFELRGIAPGNYHLFAWPDLEGESYRNAEFMKNYEDKGKAIKIEKGSRTVTEVTSVD